MGVWVHVCMSVWVERVRHYICRISVKHIKTAWVRREPVQRNRHQSGIKVAVHTKVASMWHGWNGLWRCVERVMTWVGQAAVRGTGGSGATQRTSVPVAVLRRLLIQSCRLSWLHVAGVARKLYSESKWSMGSRMLQNLKPAWVSMGQHGSAWASMGQHALVWVSMGQRGSPRLGAGQHGSAWVSTCG